jgi:hypothetical protein
LASLAGCRAASRCPAAARASVFIDQGELNEIRRILDTDARFFRIVGGVQ